MNDNNLTDFQRRFLEEAREHVKKLESFFLEIDESGKYQPQQLQAAFRAAHSLKGGAGMMEFPVLSKLSYHLEEFFELLKKDSPPLKMPEREEGLAAVGFVIDILSLLREKQLIDEEWLRTKVYPVFESLPKYEGYTDDDTEADDRDILVLVFNDRVEEILQRLESIIETPDENLLLEECLKSVLQIEGLGEMFTIEPLVKLSNDVKCRLEASPQNPRVIVTNALKKWRLSQKLILAGDSNNLPSTLDFLEEGGEPIDSSAARTPVLEISPVQPKVRSLEKYESTVRVPLDRLDEINDLFGQETIERNALSLRLERLRNFFNNLVKRISIMQKSYSYFQVANSHEIPSSNSQIDPVSNLLESAAFLDIEADSDLHLMSVQIADYIVQIQESVGDINVVLDEALTAARNLNRTALSLQNNLTEVRMRPLSDLVGQFPRFVRDLCREFNKKVELKLYGTETLIDRPILEALSDPLTHLLRNAFDHGIESPEVRRAAGKPDSGIIEIRAAYRGKQTSIVVSDDGAGIDIDKIRSRAYVMGFITEESEAEQPYSSTQLLELIFEPGFSTAPRVTSLSGRGVGMDIVRTNLQQVRGDIKVETSLGLGTTFTISIPFTLSVMRVLLVEIKGLLLAFPRDVVQELALLKPELVEIESGRQLFRWQGDLLPLCNLSRWLEFYGPRKPSFEADTSLAIAEPTVLVINSGKNYLAIQIDCFWGEQEVAIRQIERGLPMPPYLAGCTVLGDGRIVPFVDVLTLTEILLTGDRIFTGVGQPSSLPQNLSYSTAHADRERRKKLVLIIDDSIHARRIVARILTNAGYRAVQAKDGQDALNKLLDGLTVQAIVCDLEMPHLDGYEFLNRIKHSSSLKNVPVVMLTSRSADEYRARAIELGAAAYFTKPFPESEFLQTLDDLM